MNRDRHRTLNWFSAIVRYSVLVVLAWKLLKLTLLASVVLVATIALIVTTLGMLVFRRLHQRKLLELEGTLSQAMPSRRREEGNSADSQAAD